MNASTAPANHAQVASGLNLVLPLRKDFGSDRPRKLAELMLFLEMQRPKTTAALRQLNFVHFARFLPARDGSTLGVITEFDGPLQPYVMDFIIVIGDEFSKILGYMEGWPPLDHTGNPTVHVRNCPQRYWDYISRHNQVEVFGLRPFDNLHLFSAYPERTVIDIIGPASGPAPKAPEWPTEDPINLADVQANLLRGLGARHGLHLALEIRDAARARTFLGDITGDDNALPQVSDAQRWPDNARPEYRMTLGITYAGLKVLGVATETLDQFPKAYIQGPADFARARSLGDQGDSGPEHWVLGGPGQAVHLLVSLYGFEGEAGKASVAAQEARLRDRFAQRGLQVLHRQWVWVAGDQREHFGYRDGISQPRVAGLSEDAPAQGEVLPLARTGEFLLGKAYRSVYGGASIGDLPEALCTNASYAVVRLLAQDVAAFDRVLANGEMATGRTKEWVAAKLMGRARDGTPLSAVMGAPDQSTVDLRSSNAFDYAPSINHPDVENDHRGLVCPVGAHARRMNPRHARVSGQPHSHRVMRRGMMYGPSRENDPGQGEERGLYGLFICADIERQFEFPQRIWANGDIAASGIRGTQDPIIGAQDLGQGGSGPFRIPMPDGDITLTVPRLVTTRGSLYLLMPGLAGLRHLAALQTPVVAPEKVPETPLVSVRDWLVHPPKPKTARLNTASFNPKDPDFLADPYPFYKLFREKSPLLKVTYGPYESLWVFDHALAYKVCNDRNDAGDLFFHKPSQPARRLHPDPRDEPEARGLFYMDPPLHTAAREQLEPAVHQHFRDARGKAQAFAQKALAALPLGTAFDVVSQYTRPVARDTVLQCLGLPETVRVEAGRLAEQMLHRFDPMQPEQVQAEQVKFGKMLLKGMVDVGAQCPARGGGPGLWCDMVDKGVTPGGRGLRLDLPDPVTDWENRTILFTASNFVLAGFLSVDFLLGNALALLLDDGGQGMAAYRTADDAGRERILAEVQRFDPPFQLADRVAAQDTSLAGRPIPKGTLVTVCYGAANHDPNVFPDPDRFDITREIDPGKNWIFGLDHHRCIGENVAKVVTRVVLDELVNKFERLSFDPAMRPQRMTDAYLRGFSSLPLRG